MTSDSELDDFAAELAQVVSAPVSPVSVQQPEARPPGPGRVPRPAVASEQGLPLEPKNPQNPPPPLQNNNNPFGTFITRYRTDPIGFVRDILKAEPTPDQVKFLSALARGERRITIRAGHGVGKSTACSWGMLWHMLTRYPQKTVCTAPTQGQLFDALFAELKRWINALPPFLRSLIDTTTERVVLVSSPESSFISARTSSADRPEALAGIHSEHVMLVADEASAIPEKVFESAAGSMSGHSAVTVLIGNPTRNSGLFFRTHHELKGSWYALHWSCLNNPHVSPDFVKQIAETYGPESNAYRVRVLGEFALRDDDVLIPADLVDAAMERDVAFNPTAAHVYGLDVARFGDDRSVLLKRRGNVVTEWRTWKNLDLMQVCGAVINELELDGVCEQQPGGKVTILKPDHEVCVDSIGLGSGVADRLRELSFNVIDVNVSETAALNPKANRLRDDLWLAVRDWFAGRACKLPKDADLRQELVSPTYTFTSTGKVVVEGKQALKKRGLRSPDIADALCLTFASTAARVGGRGNAWVRGQPLKRNIKGVV
jgi:phage terminase large subunit